MKKPKKLKTDEVMAIGERALKQELNLNSLSEADRKRLIFGYSVEGLAATCSFYLDGPRPQDAIVLGEITVDRVTGNILSKKID